MYVKKKKLIENILKDPLMGFPIPLQNVLITDNTVLHSDLPKVKLIDIKDLQTLAYPVVAFYKPISKIIEYNEDI